MTRGPKPINQRTEADLTFKQRRFIEEMSLDPSNATAAAKRAGYGIDHARYAARALKNHPVVKQKLEESNELAAQRLGLNRERVLQELAVLAFSDLKHYVTQDEEGNTTVNLKEVDPEKSGALQELSISTKRGNKEVKVKLADKRAALMDLAKMMGWHVEKTEITGTVSLESLITQANQPEIIDSEEVSRLEKEFDEALETKLLEDKTA